MYTDVKKKHFLHIWHAIFSKSRLIMFKEITVL